MNLKHLVEIHFVLLGIESKSMNNNTESPLRIKITYKDEEAYIDPKGIPGLQGLPGKVTLSLFWEKFRGREVPHSRMIKEIVQSRKDLVGLDEALISYFSKIKAALEVVADYTRTLLESTINTSIEGLITDTVNKLSINALQDFYSLGDKQ